MEMVEGVLVEEVAFVEEKDRMEAFLAELGDMATHGVEDGSGGCRGAEAESETELSVEVSAAEGGVVTIGEAEASGGQAVAKGTQDAGFADAGLADE